MLAGHGPSECSIRRNVHEVRSVRCRRCVFCGLILGRGAPIFIPCLQLVLFLGCFSGCIGFIFFGPQTLNKRVRCASWSGVIRAFQEKRVKSFFSFVVFFWERATGYAYPLLFRAMHAWSPKCRLSDFNSLPLDGRFLHELPACLRCLHHPFFKLVLALSTPIRIQEARRIQVFT